ncbi:MAG: hypothetical protein ACI932_000834, partial [Paracoccaceae bacterium]
MSVLAKLHRIYYISNPVIYGKPSAVFTHNQLFSRGISDQWHDIFSSLAALYPRLAKGLHLRLW